MPYSPLAAGHLTRPTWHTDTHRSKTDRVAMGKYDRTESQDMQIVSRVAALAKQYGVNMQQIALAWHWAKGVASPIVGATKSYYPVSYTHSPSPRDKRQSRMPSSA